MLISYFLLSFPPAVSKIEKTGLFNLHMTTGLEEGKLWIQTSCTQILTLCCILPVVEELVNTYSFILTNICEICDNVLNSTYRVYTKGVSVWEGFSFVFLQKTEPCGQSYLRVIYSMPYHCCFIPLVSFSKFSHSLAKICAHIFLLGDSLW